VEIHWRISSGFHKDKPAATTVLSALFVAIQLEIRYLFVNAMNACLPEQRNKYSRYIPSRSPFVVLSKAFHIYAHLNALTVLSLLAWGPTFFLLDILSRDRTVRALRWA
jgi:hypothetical protein